MPVVTEYSCDEIYYLEYLNCGSFGSVYKGALHGLTDVAVKIVAGGNEGAARSEISRMRKLDHPNILKLIGIVPQSEHDYNYNCGCDSWPMQSVTWMILEYMPKGDLHCFIKGYLGGLPAYGMFKIAYQVALAMDYLHRYANIVHKDLAARNVLVKDDNFNVKIGDFGLCDSDYADHYYEGNYEKACPVRWMAPECLPSWSEQPKYTRKGDVWSFGVLLFEIWSRAMLPFNGLGNETIIRRVKKGMTVLDYHDRWSARAWVKELMKQCFQFHKSNRPNFRFIYQTIQANSEYVLT